MDNEVVKILLEIKEDTASTKATLEALAGRNGRIEQLETAQNHQWWYSSAIGPLLLIGHALARRFGVNV